MFMVRENKTNLLSSLHQAIKKTKNLQSLLASKRKIYRLIKFRCITDTLNLKTLKKISSNLACSQSNDY